MIRHRSKEAELHSACKHGDISKINDLLSSDMAPDVNSYNKAGEAPLHVIMRSSSDVITDVIAVLVENGADVNSQCINEGDSPLHKAINHVNSFYLTDITLTLLHYGADIAIKNKTMRTPYDCAVRKGHLDLLPLLDDYNINRKEIVSEYEQNMDKHYGRRLIQAIIEGNEFEINSCLSRSPDVNIVNEHGAGALHYVISHYPGDKLSLLQRLIDANANVNLEDHEGDTALNLSLKIPGRSDERLLKDIIELLLSAGTDPTIKDLDGHDALTLIRRQGYTDLKNVTKTAARQHAKAKGEKAEFADSDDEDSVNKKKKTKVCVIS